MRLVFASPQEQKAYKQMSTLLIVDDEANILYSLKKELQSDTLRVTTAETAHQGVQAVRDHPPDVVLLDVRLPDRSGLDVFREIRELDSRLPVIIMTAYSTTDLAIDVTSRGAFDFLPKPVELVELRRVVFQALELSRLNHVPAVFTNDDGVHEEIGQADRIVGKSPAMQQLYKQIGRVANQDISVLIEGESGTGKELCARAIHQYGHRGTKPFVAINTAAIPEPLLESELFGHERGAFTNAERRRIGRFEQADGGTLFLDEIGDMPLSIQAKILRVLQEGQFERIGGNELIDSDVRVVAATNHDLNELIAEGLFRQDLFYRLNGFAICLPPLRERLDDLPRLVDHYVALFNAELNRNVRGLAPGVLEMLCEHPWPGNIRELQSAIRYAFVNASGDVLTAECFPVVCCSGAKPNNDAFLKSNTQSNDNAFELDGLVAQLLLEEHPALFRRVHDEVDRFLLKTVLDHCGGNRRAASRVLGISRTTMRARLISLGLIDAIDSSE